MILGAQLHTHPLGEGGRRPPDVDSNIPHGSRDHTHQLALWLWLELIVKPAQNAFDRQGLVVLDEVDFFTDSVRERRPIPGLEERAPLILEHTGLDKDHLGYGETGGIHGLQMLRATIAAGFALPIYRMKPTIPT